MNYIFNYTKIIYIYFEKIKFCQNQSWILTLGVFLWKLLNNLISSFEKFLVFCTIIFQSMTLNSLMIVFCKKIKNYSSLKSLFWLKE